MARPQSNLAERLAGGLEAGGSELMISDSLAATLERSAVEQQIATARKYPRMITDVVRTIETLATLDEETAAECTFALTKGGKLITGPSIRFAEIVMQAWGNCRVAARITAESHRSLEATGVYHDLETNMAIAKSVAVGILKSDGGRYSNDMIVTMSGAGASKAMRNAILAGVPKGVWNGAWKAAQKVAKGEAATLGTRRKEAIAAFKSKGVPHQEVFEVLEVKGEADITLDTLFVLRGLYASITTGEDSWASILAEHRKSKEPPGKAVAPAEGGGQAASSGAREGFDADHVERETRPPGVKEGEVIDGKTGEVTSPQDQAKPASGKSASPPSEAKTTTGDSIGTSSTESQSGTASTGEDDGFPGDAAIQTLNQDAAIQKETQSGGTGAQVEGDPRPVGEGSPAPGEIYWVVGEEIGKDGKWPTFRDGKPMSRVGLKGGETHNLKLYFDHAEPAAEETARPQTEPAKPAAPDPASSASATPASTASAAAASPSAEPEATKTQSNAPATGSTDDFDFAAFQERLGKTNSWLTVKPLLVEIKRSKFWANELSEDERQASSKKFWDHVLFIKDKFNDPINPSTDASAFTLWMYWESDPKQVLAGFRQLQKMPAWGQVAAANQERMSKMVEDRIARLSATS